jgi:hypothetical protein
MVVGYAGDTSSVAGASASVLLIGHLAQSARVACRFERRLPFTDWADLDLTPDAGRADKPLACPAENNVHSTRSSHREAHTKGNSQGIKGSGPTSGLSRFRNLRN